MFIMLKRLPQLLMCACVLQFIDILSHIKEFKLIIMYNCLRI